jgi:hypothetical protein
MSHAGETLHYKLPQYEGTDIINPLVDTNDAYSKIDETMYSIAGSAAQAIQTAEEVKQDIEGTGGVDSRISALVTRMDAVETKNVEQDTSILGVQQAIQTTNGNVATNTQNISDLSSTVQGHTTSIQNLGTRVQGCENADAALDVRVTALENASGGTASDVSYDNTSSGLTATNVQDAIDEVNNKITTGSNMLKYPDYSAQTTHLTTNFTAPSDGWLYIYINEANKHVRINGVVVAYLNASGGLPIIPIKQGDVFTTDGTVSNSSVFIPSLS